MTAKMTDITSCLQSEIEKSQIEMPRWPSSSLFDPETASADLLTSVPPRDTVSCAPLPKHPNFFEDGGGSRHAVR